jgi:uncharacterized damage-inducible protein DinB
MGSVNTATEFLMAELRLARRELRRRRTLQRSGCQVRSFRTSSLLRWCAVFGLLSLVGGRSLPAQTAPEGIWEGYDGEWQHVSAQLIALAEATPEEKFAWRPALGVRSTSEVYMHIAMANFYLLSVTGPKMPADMNEGMEKTVTSKAEVIRWLKRSLEAVKQAHLAETPKDLARKVHIEDRDSTVDWMYLRIIIHANEHMGQLVAYARMTGVVPPWSR